MSQDGPSEPLRHTRRLVAPLLVSSIVLFYAGVVFAYFVVLPLVFPSMVSRASEGVQVMTSMSDYLDFVVLLWFVCGVAFEIPVATLLLVATKRVKIESLAKNRAYVVLGIAILAAALASLTALPWALMVLLMWALYELGISMSRHLLK